MLYWNGKTGTQYGFEVYAIETEFNPVSAVYMFIAPVGERWGALYVGETESLYNRLNAGRVNHDGLKRAVANGATHVAVLRVEGDTQRVGIETDLRHGLNPVCNAQSVPELSGLLS